MDLSCRIQSSRRGLDSQSSDTARPVKQVNKRHAYRPSSSDELLQAPRQVKFYCFNPKLNSDSSHQFECKPEFTKLKLVFKQNNQYSSTYIELQDSLVAFNRFVGLNLEGMRIEAKAESCEVWIEGAGLWSLLSLLMLCITSIV